MFFVLFNILLIKTRKLIHDCYKENVNFDDYSFDSFDYSISCTNNKTQNINLIYPNKESQLSIYQASNISITCPKFNQQLNTINLSIYNSPSITFQNDCCFNNIEINGSPKFNFKPNSHVFGQNLFLNNYSNDFIQEYISSNKISNKNIKSETSLLEINQWIVDCNSDMQITLSKAANIICGNKYEINFDYDFFTNVSFNLYDNYVNFQKTNYNASRYMESIISSLHYDDEINVIFTDYYSDEVDDIVDNMYDKNKLNIALKFVSFYDPYVDDPFFIHSVRWRRAAIKYNSNIELYFYGYNYNDDEIIEISSKTKTTITWVVILIVIFLMLSYCFVAQCRFYAKK